MPISPEKISPETRAHRFLERFYLCAAAMLLIVTALSFYLPYPALSAAGAGDLPGFLGPAKLIAEGRGAKLYNEAAQQEVENRMFPALAGNFLMSVYPAPTLILLTPLAMLPMEAAKAMFITIMLLATVLTGMLLARMLKTDPWLVTAWIFSSGIFFLSIAGAQNTALTAALLTAIVYYSQRSEQQRNFRPLRLNECVVGIFTGLLCYKPQYGVFVLLWLLIARRYWAFSSAIFTLAVAYLGAAPVAGIAWPVDWLSAGISFSSRNFEANGLQMSSLAALGWAADYLLNTTIWQFVALGVSALLAIVVGIYISKASDSNSSLRCWGVGIGVLPLLSPQAIFYDLGLLAISLALVHAGSSTNKRLASWDFAIFSLLSWILLSGKGWPLIFVVGAILYALWMLYILGSHKRPAARACAA